MAVNFPYSRIFSALSLILILYLFYQMLKPFLVAVLLALTLASLFYPNYVHLNAKLGQRSAVSSLIMCSALTVVILIPLILLMRSLFDELNSAYASLQVMVEAGLPGLDKTTPMLRDFIRGLGGYLGIQGADVAVVVPSVLDRTIRYLLDHYTVILSGVGGLFLKFFIMIFSMFFFFRDGDRLLSELRKLIPLAPVYEQMVVDKLKEVIFATFFGIFATGICQGVVAGLIFFFLQVENPILWGTATAFFSVVPVVGTAAVWVPMSLYLILTGSILRGILLLVLGASVIGLMDNFIRPMMIEGKAKGMHVLLVFFALLGGLFFFGPPGLILGPLVAALLVTFLEICQIEFKEELG